MSNRISPSVRYVRSLEGKYFLLREAAEILGVSHRTLRSLNNSANTEASPSFYTYLGKIKIYLYTDDDITRLRKILDSQKVVYSSSDPGPMVAPKGRPPKWTAEQRKMRQRKFSQVHYYKNIAEKHAQEGNQAKANKALQKMRAVQKQLRDEDYAQMNERIASSKKPTNDETNDGNES